MNDRAGRWSWALLPLLPLLVRAEAAGRASEAGDAPGVVVDEVARESAAAKAGLQPGDVIVSWSRAAAAAGAAAAGAIASPFDLAAVDAEQAPRGPIELRGSRGGAALRWTLSPAPLGVTARPHLDAELLALEAEGRPPADPAKAAESAGRWRAAAEQARRTEQPLLALWLQARAARALAAARRWTDADALHAAVVEKAEAVDATAAAQLLRQWADTYRGRGAWAEAGECFRRALALDEAAGAFPLTVARDLNAWGGAAFLIGDLTAAEERYRRALSIREELVPVSVDTANTLNNLGLVSYRRGDLAGAEATYQRVVQIQDRLGAVTLEVAGTLRNIGVVLFQRGDLAGAEEHYRRGLAIEEVLDPGGADAAGSLNNLGNVAAERGDAAAAEAYHRRALAIRQKLAPDSLEVAGSLHNLATAVRAAGDGVAALELELRALAIHEKLAPDSVDTATVLEAVGLAAKRQGDRERAAQLLQRALAIKEKVAPYSLAVARTVSAQARLAEEAGELALAERGYHRALEIREALAPGSSQEADSLRDLGRLQRRGGRTATASALLLRALDALERQRARWGDTDEASSGFAAKYADCYHEAIEVLVELGRPAEALHVLERSRARSLLALLAERDLLFSADIPPELARERRLADAEYDRVQAAIVRLDRSRDEAAIQARLARLQELRRTQAEIAARIRRASPHLASVQYPQPLQLEDVRSALDPGTVLLAYSVGAEKTVLFVVHPAGRAGAGLSVFTLPAGDQALRRRVEGLRHGLEQEAQAGLAARAAELYELLVRPAEAEIADSRRLLLSPDGPLHGLPFAMLVRSPHGGPRAAASFLAEWKPLHVAASATVYAELKRSRRDEPGGAGRLVAFGDPLYPALSKEQAEAVRNPDLRSLARSFSLAPLPATRREVEGIARLFAGRASAYLGEQATEERAKALGRDVRYVHFACHGFLNERFPLDSALALTVPAQPADGQDNGLLQAWEIFDRVRLDAELVTLSACETGLGKEMGGEGLLGLTRAFHYAGARSVLATLWGVPDASTSLLMERFYAHLKAGRSRDQALQAAQLDFIRARGPGQARAAGLAHPFRWAAFQLSGDWR